MPRRPTLLLLVLLLVGTACGGTSVRDGQALADSIAAAAQAQDPEVMEAVVAVANAAPGAAFDVGLAVRMVEGTDDERVAEALRDLATQVWRSELAIQSMDGLGFVAGAEDPVVTLGRAVGGDDARFPSFATLRDALGPRP